MPGCELSAREPCTEAARCCMAHRRNTSNNVHALQRARTAQTILSPWTKREVHAPVGGACRAAQSA